MKKLASYIDYTFLKSDGEKGAITKLCRIAKKHGYKTVCVNPAEIANAKKLLKNSKVKVCTVIDFPLGQATGNTRENEAMLAIKQGAEELDLVINQRLLKYDRPACEEDLENWVRWCRGCVDYYKKRNVTLKLIIECCNLTDEEKICACKMAKEAGFDFVKTSTGFGKGGATIEDVKLMRKAVGSKMGVKAAGGIRDKETALKMIKAGATRIGTSSEL